MQVSDAHSDTERIDRMTDLQRALGELSEQARAVVWLHDVEGYTHGEIGQLFGKSVSFSKTQLTRAYAQLKKNFGETHESGKVFESAAGIP